MTSALLIFLAWVALIAFAIFAGLRSPKPRQFPWLTNNKNPRSRRG